MYFLMKKWHDFWWVHYLRTATLTLKEPLDLQPDIKHMTDKANMHYKMALCYEAAIKQKRGKRRWRKQQK